MKITWPNKAEHSARKISNKSHQNGEMWNGDSKYDGNQDNGDAESATGSCQLFVLVVDGGV